jgi:starch-binding outer membrane protein SusE/F
MKKNLYIVGFLLLAVGLVTLSACKKEQADRTLLAADPGAPMLTLLNKDSVKMINPTFPTDSAITLTWTKPSYGFKTVIGYEIEMATTQANLGKKSSTSFVLPIANDSTRVSYNNLQVLDLLKSAGIAPQTSGVMYARVASFIVNSPKRARLNSNVVTVNLKRLGIATPVTNTLFLIGDADSANTWNSPALSPANKLVRVDEFTYGGVFYLQGGKEYLLLPDSSTYSTKYCLNDGDKATAGIEDGGSFVFKTTGGDNFKAPAVTGWYKITLNFGDGKFTVTPGEFVPSDLWATGEATPSSWTNSPPADQKATRIDCNTFTYKQAFVANKVMKVLSTNGAWQPQYGQKKNADVGTLDANLGSGNDPEPMAVPGTDGEYTLTVDFYNRTYSFK